MHGHQRHKRVIYLKTVRKISFIKQQDVNKQKGFTLIEVMIAVAIFGFLMLYVSQMMRGEVHLLNTVTHNDAVEQNARTAMMHILDEVRLHQATYYDPREIKKDTGTINRIYHRNPDSTQPQDTKICLLDLDPDINNLREGTGIYFDSNKHELWYRDVENSNANYRIAEYIESITITPADQYGHLIKITLKAKDPKATDSFDLVTWARLY